ncbi:hypothetical protein MIDIC_310002 [Alphaproteobacteria bacterium]
MILSKRILHTFFMILIFQLVLLDSVNHAVAAASIFDFAVGSSDYSADKHHDISDKSDVHSNISDFVLNEEKHEHRQDIDADDAAKTATNGDFHDGAQILTINVNTGNRATLTGYKDQIVYFNDLNISVEECWQENSDVYQPESKALIAIHDSKFNKLIFRGWMLKKHKFLSQPIHQEYFFYLDKCVN